MKKNKNKNNHTREPLPGSPEAPPEGGRSKGDTANTEPTPRKSGSQGKAESVADDDGMPTATKNIQRDA